MSDEMLSLTTSLANFLPAVGDTFTITDLASAFDITPRAIRFYEDQGLLQPKRVGQSRVYSRRDYARLGWILRGKNVGFSLSDIRELLDLYDTDDGRIKQRERTIELCRMRIVELTEQRADIDTMIDELQQFVGMVEGLVPAASNKKS